MEIRADDLSSRDAYRLLIACVIPRPIAWVSTCDHSGRPNLAPFSFFGGVSSAPPTLMVSVGRRRGERKDTARNLLARRECVVHIAGRTLADQMVRTSAEVPHGESEFDMAGLTTAPSTEVTPPRVAEAKIAMESILSRHLEIGAAPVDLFLLEVVRFHVDDGILADGLPDPARLAAIGRLGGISYCDTHEVFDIERG